MESEDDFIADGIPPMIAYKELTLNLENQDYYWGSRISKYFIEPMTKILCMMGII